MKTKPIIKNFLTRAAMTLGERITRPFTVMLLMLMTAATAWAAQPVGCLDACTGGEKLIHIQGWAYDPDYPAQSLPLYVFIYTDEACTKSYDVIIRPTYRGPTSTRRRASRATTVSISTFPSPTQALTG